MAKSKFPSCFRIFPNYFIRNSELYSESPATGVMIIMKLIEIVVIYILFTFFNKLG